jgi:hypothetical protein
MPFSGSRKMTRRAWRSGGWLEAGTAYCRRNGTTTSRGELDNQIVPVALAACPETGPRNEYQSERCTRRVLIYTG